ncbi:hypothetical protein F511_15720 [Dorcoceras hygrometricum]|uniref:Aminotransferase-like plant mobile domain-containing protein n=1 Tax=Dorcoceras hygrometricum TaxID=472368 RepID=A0A2Z7D8B3_9LAMI|nr:hypothetical protein F511_15720 [Dorcoceras hygrometricum]
MPPASMWPSRPFACILDISLPLLICIRPNPVFKFDMPPKGKSKIPHGSRVSPTKSLKFLSQIPWPIFVESPANPFLISCISHRRSVPRAPISPLPQIPSAVPTSCVASSTLRPLSVVFRGAPLGFASFSSAFNRFGAPRLLVMSNSEQCVDRPIADNRSEMGVVLPVEAIGPIDHPSYSDNAFPATIQNRLFPVHFQSSTDLLLSQFLLPHAVPAQFKSWPRVSAQWIDWVNRLQPRFGDQWKSQGLWSLIELSKVGIPKQSLLFDCLIRFWSPANNAFIFAWGPMSLTLYDIYLFTGLPLIGPDSPYLTDDPAAPKLAPLRYCYPSHRAVVKSMRIAPRTQLRLSTLCFCGCSYVSMFFVLSPESLLLNTSPWPVP